MKQSRFNIWVEDYPEKGSHLLFNARTQALLQLDSEMKRAVCALPDSAGLRESIRLGEHIEALKENGVVVSDEAEEAAKLVDFFRQLKFESRDALSFEATILTTYACNFRCVYCFEESVRSSVSMSSETAQATIAWLSDRIARRNLKKVFLVFYGGEPLVNPDPIVAISGSVRDVLRKRGGEFGFGIITNGSLLSPGLIKKLLPNGLSSVRVTLDGDRAAHDAKRPFADGSGSFGRIIDNIKAVMDIVQVDIAGNFDKENLDGIVRLLDYLDKEGILRRLGRIDFSPIMPRLGPKDNPGFIGLKKCLSFFSKKGLFNETMMIKRELLKRGINSPTGLAVNACPLIMEDIGATIDPEGVIYRCNALVGYQEFSVGTVQDGGFDENSKKYLAYDAWKRCPEDCSYVPMCQGGCRFFAYIENKDVMSLACKREYFNEIMPDLIKLEFDKINGGVGKAENGSGKELCGKT